MDTLGSLGDALGSLGDHVGSLGSPWGDLLGARGAVEGHGNTLRSLYGRPATPGETFQGGQGCLRKPIRAAGNDLGSLLGRQGRLGGPSGRSGAPGTAWGAFPGARGNFVKPFREAGAAWGSPSGKPGTSGWPFWGGLLGIRVFLGRTAWIDLPGIHVYIVFT